MPRERLHLTTDECRALRAHELVTRALAEGWRAGMSRWYRESTGQTTGRCAWSIDLAEDSGRAALAHDDGDQVVELVTTTPRFAGVRWWWRCPGHDCGRRVAALYQRPGGGPFRCRTCHHLTYESRREPVQFRLIGQAFRHIRRRDRRR